VPGRAYAVWYENPTAVSGQATAISIATTIDGGATWTPPRPLYRPNDGAAVAAATLKVLPDGGLLVAFLAIYATAREFDRQMTTRSADGGLTWSPPVQVGTTSARFAVDPEGDNEKSGLDDAPSWQGDDIGSYPSPSLDVSPDGIAYIAWQDIRNPDTYSYSSRLMMARSLDGGRTWQPPQAVVSEATQAYMPTLAAGRSGSIALTYYDLRNDRLGDDPLTTDVWAAVSSDGGRTWAEAHLGGAFDTRSLATGEYFGLAAVPGGFAAAFELDRTDPEPPRDIWFARIDSPADAHGTL
jgi:Neuraminidase (sialidase)